MKIITRFGTFPNDLLGIFLNQQTLLSTSYPGEVEQSEKRAWSRKHLIIFHFICCREKINLRKLNFRERGKNRNKLLRGTIMNFNVINERLK